MTIIKPSEHCALINNSPEVPPTCHRGHFYVRPTRYAYCGESPCGAAMMRNPRPEEQLRGGNKPWERKFKGKSRLYEQHFPMPAYTWDFSNTLIRIENIEYLILIPFRYPFLHTLWVAMRFVTHRWATK